MKRAQPGKLYQPAAGIEPVPVESVAGRGFGATFGVNGPGASGSLEPRAGYLAPKWRNALTCATLGPWHLS